MILKEILHILKYKGWIYAGLLVGIFFCYKTVVIDQNYKLGIIIGCLPLIIIAGSIFFRRSFYTLFLLFVVNYYIMGVMRYVDVPAGIIIDGLFALLTASLVFRSAYETLEWKRALNGLTLICFLWFLYCLFQLANTTTAINPGHWVQGVRSIAIYPLLTVIFTSLMMKKYDDIVWLLVLWGFLTLTAAAKGYAQKNWGFDSAELRWLFFHDGARTHLIQTGIRFFSFFTDAGNYGSNMGFSLVVFSIATFAIKNKFLKVYFLIVALAGGYGMIISGTRGALGVPFAGFALFVLLSKNWKSFIGMSLFLVLAFLFLNYTTIGDSNRFVQRMRSAFDTDDASLQVRVDNQEMLVNLMSDLPFGIGIGASTDTADPQTPAFRIATIPPDSYWVRIWTRTGIFGLVLNLILWGATLAIGSYIILFKIKNKELRNILAGMLCGTFGMMVSSYGNDFYAQFPNGILIYGSQALVFLGPYIDQDLTAEKEAKLLTQNNDETRS